jgi:hypothetical protein
MIHLHSSTAKPRAQWVSILVAQEGSYGVVSQLGKEAKVSRQTLYSWKAKGRSALQGAFEPQEPQATIPLERAVLTLTSGRTRQLSGHSSLSGRPAGPAGQPGNDHGHRARGWRACAKVVGAASLRARTRVGLG